MNVNILRLNALGKIEDVAGIGKVTKHDPERLAIADIYRSGTTSARNRQVSFTTVSAGIS
jgi:hypothetical protein